MSPEPMDADAARERIAAMQREGLPALPSFTTMPGALAGMPTPFDVVGRTLVGLRTQLEGLAVGITAALDQVDTATSALWLITPPEHRAALERIIAGEAAAAGHVGSAERSGARDSLEPREAAPEPASQRPRTFMDRHNREG